MYGLRVRRVGKFKAQSRGMERNARGSWDESRSGCAGRTADEDRGVGGGTERNVEGPFFL